MLFLLATALFTLSACSPLVNHPGPRIAAAKIEDGQFVATDGSRLPLRRWLPKEAPVTAVVVALHGFNDYSNAFTAPGSYLSGRGIACYAYDQRGFGAAPGRGLWSGVDAYTADITDFVRQVRMLHPAVPAYLLGESMGGAVVIAAMTGTNPPPVDGVILVAPAVWGRETMPWYQRWLLAVASHTVPWMELTGKGVHVTPSDNSEMLRALGRDPKIIKATRIDTLHGLSNLMDEALVRTEKLQIPTLIQYGEHDEIIPVVPMLRTLEKVPATTRKAFYKKGYHMLLRDLHAEQPLGDIAAWITDRSRPLPYGSDRWQ
jgi:alpha-beta hydrolase superfamily lysophospholipase